MQRARLAEQEGAAEVETMHTARENRQQGGPAAGAGGPL